MPRCRGLIGFLFGHKFNYNTLDYHYASFPDFCQRCGMKRQA